MAAEHMIDVEVLTPEGEVYEGEARMVSTRTEVGEIGILANGWLQIYGNRARLLVEEAIPPEDLDAGVLKEQLSDAEQRLSESDEESAEFARAQKDKDRAEAFLSIAAG